MINNEEIFTRVEDGDAAYKKCECYICGKIQHCTPHFDYYSEKKSGLEGLLYCESCFRKRCLEEYDIPEENIINLTLNQVDN